MIGLLFSGADHCEQGNLPNVGLTSENAFEKEDISVLMSLPDAGSIFNCDLLGRLSRTIRVDASKFVFCLVFPSFLREL